MSLEPKPTESTGIGKCIATLILKHLALKASLAIGSGLIGPTRVYIGSGWVGPGVERFGPGWVAQVANPG